jgi:CubicO group peptidase (beta-lactamase class C family)
MTLDFSPVETLLSDARTRRAFPAATIEVGRRDGVLWQYACGTLTYDEGAAPTALDTIFDLASLTKVLSTTAIAMRLVHERRLPLNAPLGAYLEDWRGHDRSMVTIADALEHASGLTAWGDVYRRGDTRRAFAHEIATMPLEYAPRSRSIYSDLGFILLGFVLEAIDGCPLDAQFNETFDEDYELMWGAPHSLRARVAPTEDDRTWRGRLLVGEVHDENAWALGGAAGHAGLFGTAPGVGAYARLVLETLRRETLLGPPWLMQRFLRPSRVPRSSRALGWDLMRPTSSCGRKLSRSAFGHTGFTGTSLWIDPLQDLYVVLLTNRVHPKRPDTPHDALAALRPAVHEAVVDVVSRR